MAMMGYGANEADIKKARNVVQERLNLLYIQNCSKKCPNCEFPIQKSDGCNKMQCQNCSTKFCWKCRAILCTVNPYDHFTNNAGCWSFETQQEELKEEEIKGSVSDKDYAMSMINIENTANCPKCMGF